MDNAYPQILVFVTMDIQRILKITEIVYQFAARPVLMANALHQTNVPVTMGSQIT
jgi:hypothetical protein